MQSIPTYLGQEIDRCCKNIREAQAALKNPEIVPLQKYNWKRRLLAQQKRLKDLATRKLPH